MAFQTVPVPLALPLPPLHTVARLIYLKVILEAVSCLKPFGDGASPPGWCLNSKQGTLVLPGSSGHSNVPAVPGALHTSCWGPPSTPALPSAWEAPLLSVAKVCLLRPQPDFCFSSASRFGPSSLLNPLCLQSSLPFVRVTITLERPLAPHLLQCICLLEGRD